MPIATPTRPPALALLLTTMWRTVFSLFTLLCALLVPLAKASDNGDDMSMDDGITLASGTMLSYLHFTPGDILWFQGWVPSTAGAMVGTCIGLFLLALVERWIATGRAVMYGHWKQQAQILCQQRIALPVCALPDDTKEPTSAVVTSARASSQMPLITFPPFIFAHDIPRGLIYAVQVALNYAFMLTVMTFQLGFILSLIVGLGVGETLFGRFSSSAIH